MKMQYDVEKKKILMTTNDAKQLEMFAKGHKAAAMKIMATAQAQPDFLASDLLPYATNVPADMNVKDFFNAVKKSAKALGVDLDNL